jgi:hypothetical protein
MRDALRERIAALDDANQRLEEQPVVISLLNRMLRHNMRNEMESRARVRTAHRR